jgi:2',3'-cyclic-nucleotide 2'-phosphodiesterase/3'-nucleotidase
VLLLDNGDILQGQPIVYYSNFEKTQSPHVLSRVMNYMKYDAGSVGNHDIEAGHEVYDKFTKELNFPWLAANAIDKKTKTPYFQPYTIVEKDGIKIAILGLITPAIPKWLPEKIWEGMEFEDMIESAKKWIQVIHEKEKPDLVIGIFHAGIDYTYGNQTAESYKNENATKLVAQQVEGFDIIIGGHDHQLFKEWIPNPKGKKVMVLDPKNSAQYIAEVKVEIDLDSEIDFYRKKISGEMVKVSDIKADKDFLKEFNSDFEEVKRYVSKEIGHFTKSISTRDAFFGNCEFIDLVQQIQLELTGADISFASPLSYNAEIREGKVFIRDMFKLYKFENLLYTMKLSGKEIKKYLEFSYSKWFKTMKDKKDSMLLFVENPDGTKKLAGQFFNFSSAAGIDYEVDITKNIGQRVKIKQMSDGKPFEEEKFYKVAVNSYRGNGGGNHLTDGAGIAKEELASRIITSTEKDLRYYIIKWIEQKQTIEPKRFDNWKVVPERFWKKAKYKDYDILFNR